MRVRMLRLMASPERTAQPGQIIDLPDAEAHKRIAAGDCAPVDADQPNPARPRPAAAAADGRPLEKRTVAELQAYCDQHGIDTGGATRKAELLAAIEQARDADDDG